MYSSVAVLRDKYRIMRQTVLILLAIAYFSKDSVASVNHNGRAESVLLLNSEDVENALYLTPLIERGNIDEARKKSLVQHKQMINVESYAGYLTINKQYNSNSFFWFFPSQTNPKNSPVLLWLNGGPGVSSLIGLFEENGPFIIKENQTLELRQYSWHRNHNIIYIDNPVGVGYSFTNDNSGYASNQTRIGQDLLEALVQFFKLYPELQENEFYITGESYAGKYILSVSCAIKNYNQKSGIPFKINLKGLAIGNGLMDSLYQFKYSDFLYRIGLVDFNGRDQLKEIEEEIRLLLKQNKYTEATMVNDKILLNMFTESPSVFENLTGFVSHQNYLINEDTEIDYFVGFLQRSDIRKAMHVGNRTYTRVNRYVANNFKADIMQSVTSLLTDLIQHYKILIYNGQTDIIIPYTGTQDLIRNLDWPSAEEFERAMRKQWWVGNELAGYSKIVGNLWEVLVRNAGHMVPADQPKWAHDLITHFTHGNLL